MTTATGSGGTATFISGSPNFSIRGPSPGPVLDLGAPRQLPLMFNNPNPVAVTVTSLTVSLAVPVPANCGGSNLTVNGSSLVGPVTIPQSVLVAAQGSAASSVLSLELVDKTLVNQDACQRQRFTLGYAGTAQYTDSTQTVLAATPDPSKHGQSVMITATVGSTYSHPHGPTGTVTFHRCTNTDCTNSATLGSRSLGSSGVASISTTVLPVGTSHLYATYGGAGTDFSGSSSARISHRVLKAAWRAPARCIVISGSKPSRIINGSHAGDIMVRRGEVLLLDGGRLTGNITVGSGGTLLGRAGTISGRIVSRGALVLDQVTVNGGVKILGGGRVCLSHGTVTHDVLVSHTRSGVRASRVCGMTIDGSLTFIDNGAASRAGGTAHCMGNVIHGRLVVRGNNARVRIGGLVTGRGNVAAAGITVARNHAGGLLRHNRTAGRCVLSGNQPPIHGTGNTAARRDSCNRNA